MAQTFLATANGIPFTATNQSILCVFNGSGSGKILKVYRVWLENCQVTALTGGNNILTLSRITAATASNWTIAPVSLDTTNTSLPAQVIAGAKFTVTTSDIFRRMMWSNDEPTIATGTIDEFQLFAPYTCMIDNSYTDANVIPIVCREGQGVSIQNVGFSATAPANAGLVDCFIEFTSE
jgi:hypothetical protein